MKLCHKKLNSYCIKLKNTDGLFCNMKLQNVSKEWSIILFFYIEFLKVLIIIKKKKIIYSQ